MKKNRNILVILAGLTAEAVLIVVSYFIAYAVRFCLMDGIDNILHLKYGIRILPFYVLYACGLFCILRIFAFDEYSYVSSRIECITVVHILGGIALIAVLFLLHIDDFSRLFIAFFTVINIILSVAEFLIMDRLVGLVRSRAGNKKHVVVFGNGDLSREYINYINQHPEYGIVVDGYVSRVKKEGLGTNLGNYEDVLSILDELDPNELVIALESHETGFLPLALEAANVEGIGVQLIPFYNKYLPTHPELDKAGDINLINLRSTPLDSIASRILKRTVDVIGSVILIVVTLPVMIVAAIGVKFSSPGPVLFKQKRIGKDKKEFEMYKFRSMRVSDSEDSGWTTKDDPRKTKFGSFIRKYSIDELPQFFNVLMGDMSLVGPRPEVPYHVRHFKTEIPRYLVRQQVKPGITGWAQVHGLRGDTSINSRVDYDIWYIENWSFWLDIKILLMTVFKGFKNDEEIVR